MAKFLILRFSSIGDIVLTSPVVRMLKTQVKDSEVHFCTKERYQSLVSSNPYLDKVHLLKEDLSSLIKDLQKENFDYIIDLHKNLRTLRIKSSLGKKTFSFHKLNIRKWLLVNFKVNLLPDLHIVDRYLQTIESFGIKNDGNGLDFFIPEKEHIPIDSLPASHQQGYIAFAIGAQHGTKKLPADRIIELCKTLGKPVVLLGDHLDQAEGDSIEKGLSGIIPVYNACGKYNLYQSASLLQQSQLVVTHDTGLMHIASALKKKIISVWGSTIPQFGMYPYGTEHVILENKNLKCRPCSKIGYKKCPQGHFKCMREISFKDLSEFSECRNFQNNSISDRT